MQDRPQLNRYLSQSTWDEYRAFEPNGAVKQRSTFVKSYIIEGHTNGGPPAEAQWKQAFEFVLPRRDESLVLLEDRDGTFYFADLSDPRFLVIHTIGKTDTTDPTIERLTQGLAEGFDRAWLPTGFLFGLALGPLRGFKFGYQAALAGIASNGFGPGASPDDLTIESSENLPDVHQQEGEDQNAARPPATVSALASKLAVSNTVTAADDYRRIKEAGVFEGRQALDSVEFVAANEQGDRVISDIYASGKLVGNGTSVGLHLLLVNEVRSAYSRVVTRIEKDWALGWERSGDAIVHKEEPLVFLFPQGMVVDLYTFVTSMFAAIRPFRLFGIPHSVTERRIDVEAIDLHTNDPLSFEITREWMRVYLPRGSCGNIIARLYTNLQHAGHSDISLATGSGEALFTEAAARAE